MRRRDGRRRRGCPRERGDGPRIRRRPRDYRRGASALGVVFERLGSAPSAGRPRRADRAVPNAGHRRGCDAAEGARGCRGGCGDERRGAATRGGALSFIPDLRQGVAPPGLGARVRSQARAGRPRAARRARRRGPTPRTRNEARAHRDGDWRARPGGGGAAPPP